MWLLDPLYLATLLAGGVVKLALALAALLRPGPIGPGRVARAATAAAAVTLVELVLVRLQGANAFATLMLAWIDLALVAPLCGAALLGLARGRASRGARALALSALAIVPVAAWASLVEPRRLVVERPRLVLRAARAGSTPVRIGVLADLQTTRVGGHERRAVARLMAERPDLILVPGDLFQGSDADWTRARPGLRALLETLDAPGGVFVVSGNSDHRSGLPQLLAGTRCELLVNRTREVRIGDRRLRLLGLEEAGFPRRIVADFEASAAADPRVVHLILVHRAGAGVAALSASSPVDLVVGGHTHGGQVVVPGLGPPLTLSSLPRRVAAGGLHPLRGSQIYVSRGVGMERRWAPRIRLFCRPEVTLLTLE